MKLQWKRCAVLVAAIGALAVFAILPAQAQTAGKYLAPKDQVVAIRAGRLFDARSGMMLSNQVVIVRGDRITYAGPNLPSSVGRERHRSIECHCDARHDRRTCARQHRRQ